MLDQNEPRQRSGVMIAVMVFGLATIVFALSTSFVLSLGALGFTLALATAWNGRNLFAMQTGRNT